MKLQIVAFPFYMELKKEQLLVAAVLHDVVEDTDFSLDQVRKEFGDVVADIGDSVTRRESDGIKEFYRDFIYRPAR